MECLLNSAIVRLDSNSYFGNWNLSSKKPQSNKTLGAAIWAQITSIQQNFESLFQSFESSELVGAKHLSIWNTFFRVLFHLLLVFLSKVSSSSAWEGEENFLQDKIKKKWKPCQDSYILLWISHSLMQRSRSSIIRIKWLVKNIQTTERWPSRS